MDIRFTKNSLYVLLSAIILGILFNQCPLLDLSLSALFYDAAKGGFYLNDNIFVKSIYLGVKFVVLLTTGLIIYFTWRIYQLTGSLHPRDYSKMIFFILVIAMGPGVIIHNVIKDNIDRPRPRHIEQFGGKSTFAPAFAFVYESSKPSGYADHSFVSGHSAVGFMFMALAFLASGKLRNKIFLYSTIFGLFIGMGRIMQGGHYLSDVVFAGYTVYFTALLIGVAMTKLFFPLQHKQRTK